MLNIIFDWETALISIFMIVPVAISIIYRNSECNKMRDSKPLVPLFFVNFIAVIIQYDIIFIEDSYNYLSNSCKYGAILTLVTLNPFLLIYFMRAFSLWKKFAFNNNERIDIAILGYKILSAMKKSSNSWFRAWIYPLLGFFIGALEGYVISELDYSCTASGLWYFACKCFYVLIICFITFCLRKVNDVYYIKTEFYGVILLALAGLLISGCFSVLGTIYYSKLAKKVMLATFIAIHALTFSFPLYSELKHRQATRLRSSLQHNDYTLKNSINLKCIMMNDVKKTIFSGICARYFVMENFYFLEAYYKINQNATFSEFSELVNMYIDCCSLYQININYDLRLRACASTNLDELKDIFALVEYDIVLMLKENVIQAYLDKISK
eukprot:NODE_45_length_27728_cov_0.328387.p4 type:complete len:382 gc:universal NODE_45_length_27728_cov_0.328387:9148-8003(-)